MRETSRVMDVMGTQAKITIDHPDAERILTKAEIMLKQYEERFSLNNPHSDVVKINQKAGLESVQVAADLFNLIKMGREVSLASNSTFNIAIGALTKLWHIGFSDAQLPDKIAIQECLSLVNPADIVLEERTQSVYLRHKGMALDINALGKGYFSDHLKAYLKEEGVNAGRIDLGTNVLTLGSSPNHNSDYWLVEISNPFEAESEAVLALRVHEKSVVSSSINERKLKVGTKYYHHIFDSMTGYPVEGQNVSVTIVSEQSMDGEVWSTMLLAQTPQRALAWLNQAEGVEGIVITKEKQILISDQLKNKIERLSNTI